MPNYKTFASGTSKASRFMSNNEKPKNLKDTLWMTANQLRANSIWAYTMDGLSSNPIPFYY